MFCGDQSLQVLTCQTIKYGRANVGPPISFKILEIVENIRIDPFKADESYHLRNALVWFHLKILPNSAFSLLISNENWNSRIITYYEMRYRGLSTFGGPWLMDHKLQRTITRTDYGKYQVSLMTQFWFRFRHLDFEKSGFLDYFRLWNFLFA